MKKVLDGGCIIHGTRVCEVAAAYFYGRTHHCLKEARQWRTACRKSAAEGVAWVAARVVRGVETAHHARERAKTDSAVGWLASEVPKISCSPPNKQELLVLNMTLGRELWKLYLADKVCYPQQTP
jgi:hypothetical protein